MTASIASGVALISIVHLFLFPVVPSFDYFSVRQVQNSCVPVNGSDGGRSGRDWENLRPIIALDSRFPVDSHGAVVYRNTPWKAEIGQWLAGCDSITKEVNITEVIIILSLYLLIHFSSCECADFLCVHGRCLFPRTHKHAQRIDISISLINLV